MNALPRVGWAVGIVLVLALALAGCKKKKDAEPEPPDTERNPLKPDPAGGPPAANDVLRGAQLPVIKNLMHNLGLYYIAYRGDRGQPPRTREEFLTYLKNEPDARILVQALEKDWLVLRLDPPPSATQVLAHEKEPYKKWNNRVVLRGGGAIKVMEDAEFQEALKR